MGDKGKSARHSWVNDWETEYRRLIRYSERLCRKHNLRTADGSDVLHDVLANLNYQDFPLGYVRTCIHNLIVDIRRRELCENSIVDAQAYIMRERRRSFKRRIR